VDDRSLYSQILEIRPPWFVSGVSVDPAREEVLVRVELLRGSELRCPVCSAVCSGYDSGEDRRWRHLDSCGFKTYLVSKTIRMNCPEHGVKTLGVPWSEAYSRYAAQFECMAIQIILATKSQVRAARILRLSPGQVHDLMHRAVVRGIARRTAQPIAHLSLDEKAFKSNKRFVSVLTDIEGRRVLDLCLERTSEATERLIRDTLNPAQLLCVKSVCMDMWDGFIKASRAVWEGVDLIFDRFHVARYLNDAVDRTRIDEHKSLKKQGDDRPSGSKFFWASRPENLKPKQVEKYGDLRQANLLTAKAWALKENFRAFFDLPSKDQAESFFEAWQQDVLDSGNKPMAKVAKMLKRYFYGLENYLEHRKTNSSAEGVNAMIQEVKFAARGFRTFEAFRVAVLFFLGKLSLYPLKTP
jgi:transposase